MLHHEECAADHRFVFDQKQRARDGYRMGLRALITRNSRSIACAEGSNFATGPGLLRITKFALVSFLSR